MTFAVNHLGYFLLTALFLDSLLSASEGHVINVSGERHRSADSDFERCLNPLTFERRYALSAAKLANIVFTLELAERLCNTRVSVNAVHPGTVATRALTNGRLIPRLKHMYCARKGGMISARKGANTVVFMATSPDMRGVTGRYYYCRKLLEPSPVSKTPEAAGKLWKMRLEMTHLDDAIGSGWKYLKP